MNDSTSKLPVSPAEFASLEAQLADARDRLHSALEDADDIMRGWSDHAEKASYAASIGQLRSRVDYLTHRLDSVFPSDDAGQSNVPAEGKKRTIETANAADVDLDAPSRAVGLNSRVVVEFEGEEETYVIVDESDAWVARGLISSASPLAQALMGKRAGETAEYEAPGGMTRVTIVRIE